LSVDYTTEQMLQVDGIHQWLSSMLIMVGTVKVAFVKHVAIMQ